MLLVANLANTKWCKKAEKWLKPRQMGTHLRVLSESSPMNTNMWQGLDDFQKYLRSCVWDNSSLRIGRVKTILTAGHLLEARSINLAIDLAGDQYGTGGLTGQTWLVIRGQWEPSYEWQVTSGQSVRPRSLQIAAWPLMAAAGAVGGWLINLHNIANHRRIYRFPISLWLLWNIPVVTMSDHFEWPYGSMTLAAFTAKWPEH